MQTDTQTACAPPGSLHAVVLHPNGYDLSFLNWFKKHGWQIRAGTTIEVWVFNDAHCPFRVTQGMIERLAAKRHIHRVFPDNAGNDEVWMTPEW